MAAAPTIDEFAEYLGQQQGSSPAGLDDSLGVGVQWVEERCGPFEDTPYTTTLYTSGGVLTLPVVRPTTATATGPGPTPVTVLDVDPDTCVVRCATGPTGRWTFTGTHGWAGEAPPGMKSAALIVAALDWSHRRRGSLRTGQSTPERQAGFPRALHLIRDYMPPRA